LKTSLEDFDMKWQFLIILGALIASATASAEPTQGLFLEMRMGGHVAEDASVDAVSNENVIPMFQLVAGAQIPMVEGLRVGVIYKVKAEELAPSRFGNTLNVDWDWTQVLAFGDYGIDLFGFLRPSLRVGLGYSNQYIGVTLNNRLHEDSAHDLAYMASLNLESKFKIHEGEATQLHLSVLGEFGYQGQTTATFDELERDGSDEWDRQAPSFGDLHTDGLLWSFGVGLIVTF